MAHSFSSVNIAVTNYLHITELSISTQKRKKRFILKTTLIILSCVVFNHNIYNLKRQYIHSANIYLSNTSSTRSLKEVIIHWISWYQLFAGCDDVSRWLNLGFHRYHHRILYYTILLQTISTRGDIFSFNQ